LTCRYCQSWQFAQARPEQTDNKDLTPAQLVGEAKKYGLKSITFTFSEPTQCIEYILDTAKAAKSAGIAVTLHTAAYISERPLKDLCAAVAAINVDFKGWTEDFYQRVCGGKMAPMLAALKTIKASGTWLELTTLVIPGFNDDLNQAAQMATWVKTNLGPDVPWHFSRFYPKYKMLNVPPTPLETIKDVRNAVWKQGLHYVYINNVAGDPAESTYCPKCGTRLIQRIGFDRIQNTGLKLPAGKCLKCGLKIPGFWT
jgi:pyruvate formate lyase activating enzyme